VDERDEGRQWECIARHLPEIYAVETATRAVNAGVKILIPSALHSYTGGARAEAEGQTLADVLADWTGATRASASA
jgi:hypothetical protein